ncbi:SDR family NAD(P)-dependent oxidoreductase [Bordetella genomosp. 12]|uniref:3-oxoacyl-ACP reductase n=1 Tax=Bordetella genomosp. 12 TaxID=463035 RepID=A0A261VA31_9BORD|nr:SDR family NAD(P)-dependent oxidoreductase [Bordetella genomosp. 12]OZI70835.1 3-oxoacyl-ACP reductase [Bordetella genomosp. 12]
MFRLDGKVALVTGCGTLGEGWGNGKAAAAALARQGATVYGCDLDPDAAAQTAATVIAEGGKMTVRQCDVTRADEVAALIQACIQVYGRIDILVNNVGRSEPGDPVTLSQDAWDDQLQVNLTSAFLCCKHVIPLMKHAGGGSIINISSIAGLRYAGKPQVGYAAAKAALMQMTTTTAVIYARDNVRLNCVVPGLMFTPLVARLAQKYAQGDYEGFVAHRHGQVPMGRMGDAWDVAHAVAFLASDESRYITGQQIVVDGGITMATA